MLGVREISVLVRGRSGSSRSADRSRTWGGWRCRWRGLQDHAQPEVAPIVGRQHRPEFVLDLYGVGLGREAEPSRDATDVRVERQPRQPERDRAHHVRRLATDTRQRRQFLVRRRHDSRVPLDHRAAPCLRGSSPCCGRGRGSGSAVRSARVTPSPSCRHRGRRRTTRASLCSPSRRWKSQERIVAVSN